VECEDRLGDVVGGAQAAERGAAGYLEHKVADPELRARLTPAYPVGCKRVLVSSAFYPAVQRDDVELVTDPIERVTATGVRTVGGRERACDTLVLCTGFRATEYLRGVDVTGRAGTRLHDHWAGVPRAYHGLAVPGFPNLFLLYGPNTNQGGNSILLILEAQAHWVAAALAAMGEGATAEVRPEAMRRYAAELTTALDATVWRDGCASYFRTPGGDIVTQLPHTSAWYRDRTSTFDADDFVLH
jgi:cation diffusion facilitator CzcD-associated flavoprotein CzcO